MVTQVEVRTDDSVCAESSLAMDMIRAKMNEQKVPARYTAVREDARADESGKCIAHSPTADCLTSSLAGWRSIHPRMHILIQ